MNPSPTFRNPYTPGAGHAPPYLAGRENEIAEFERLLDQDRILDNVVLTGLRGVGKTVLLERFKSLAISRGWLWAGNDLSESASVTEQSLATRIIADLSVATAGVHFRVPATPVGFSTQPSFDDVMLSFEHLADVYSQHPGLPADKIRAVLEFTWSILRDRPAQNRIIFAYDEAQNLADHSASNEFPLSTLLDVFKSIQAQGIPFMLVLTGLPTLFPKLIEARTYAERMFHIMTLGRLNEKDSADAVEVPLHETNCPVRMTQSSVNAIVQESAGYPYFIQFICREVYDVFVQYNNRGETLPEVPLDSIQRKLDVDFFSGRWARLTDRQRDLMWIIASLDSSDEEFKIQEITERAKNSHIKAFSASHVNQMLVSLSQHGLVYKNRFGKYSFAVPLMASFIRRTYQPNEL